MKRAVCLFCGEGKAGAFVLCPNCARCPETGDDLILSLVMTEPHLDELGREAVGQDIKHRGKRPSLDSETRERLRAQLEEFKRVPVVK
jgi:hypothetical protein